MKLHFDKLLKKPAYVNIGFFVVFQPQERLISDPKSPLAIPLRTISYAIGSLREEKRGHSFDVELYMCSRLKVFLCMQNIVQITANHCKFF